MTEEPQSKRLSQAASSGSIKVVSFDVEGTLVTPDFSIGMLYDCIPEAYGKKKGLDLEEARKAIVKEYERVGDGSLEWYDARHWFRFFELGDYRGALDRCRKRIAFYPEVEEVLSAVSRRYRLIVISSSIREFLEHLVADIQGHFDVVVSTISDHAELKTPQLYLKICQSLNIQPREMVHVGDNRQYDFTNAAAAGVHAVHLDRPGNCRGDGAITSLLEFRDLLLGRGSP